MQLQGAGVPAALMPMHPAGMHAAAHVDPRAHAAAAAAHARGQQGGYAAAVHPYAHALGVDPR